MARIETYVTDSLVTENDIVIGTDGDDLNKTKNFKVSALTQFVESQATNNIAKVITTSVGVSETIESKFDDLSFTVVGEDSPVLLVFLKEEEQQETSVNVIRKFVYLFTKGNGTYTSVNGDDLVLLNVSNPTAQDIDSLANTVTIDLGDISGSTLVDTVNGSIPSLDLSDSGKEYFFTFIDSGTTFLFKFVGANGLYGSNDLQSVSSDFVSFSDSSVDDDNVKAKFVNITLSSSYQTETDEIGAVASFINTNNTPIEIADKELFIAFSNDLENDNGVTYTSVYIINTGKGVYGDTNKQITKSNVIKVRGDARNELLSSFTNDADFATNAYVDQQDNLKVSKDGDTMSGNLDMGQNAITNVDLPVSQSDVANKFYVDSLNRFRGEFNSSSNITSLTSNNDGDYATLSNGDVNQLWIYQGNAWVLESAKPYVVDISSNTTLSNDFHKATINVTTGNINLDLPDGLIDGIEFNIRNFSGGTLTFNTTGTNTTTSTSLPTNNLATAILSGTEYIIDTTSSEISENINIGLYDYEDTQSAQTLVADTFQNISNNGAGANTYKDPAPGVNDIYNIGTDRFDFSGLNINDYVRIRLDLTITTATAGEVVDCELLLGEGQAGEYSVPVFSSKYFKDSSTYRLAENLEVYIGNNLTKDNPAVLRIKSSGADDVLVNGFYVRVVKRG